MVALALAAFIGIFFISTAEIDGLGSDALASGERTNTIHLGSNSQTNLQPLEVTPPVASVAEPIAQEKKSAQSIQPASQETTTGEEVAVIATPKDRTVMKWGKDDEKSDDWVK